MANEEEKSITAINEKIKRIYKSKIFSHMTRKQEDKLSMWTTVDTVLTNYQAVWPKLKAFEKAVTTFRTIRQEIDPEAGKQRSSIAGVTEDKQSARNYLIVLAQQMILNIEAFAMAEENFTLQKQFSFTPSYYERLRDNALPILVNATLAKATELSNALEPYGINQKSIDDLTRALDHYSNSNASPRVAVGERKAATINIVSKLAEGMHQLEIMDNLSGNFNTVSPEFVAAYRNGRMVINLGSRTSKEPKKHPPLTGN